MTLCSNLVPKSIQRRELHEECLELERISKNPPSKSNIDRIKTLMNFNLFRGIDYINTRKTIQYVNM